MLYYIFFDPKCSITRYLHQCLLCKHYSTMLALLPVAPLGLAWVSPEPDLSPYCCWGMPETLNHCSLEHNNLFGAVPQVLNIVYKMIISQVLNICTFPVVGFTCADRRVENNKKKETTTTKTKRNKVRQDLLGH